MYTVAAIDAKSKNMQKILAAISTLHAFEIPANAENSLGENFERMCRRRSLIYTKSSSFD